MRLSIRKQPVSKQMDFALGCRDAGWTNLRRAHVAGHQLVVTSPQSNRVCKCAVKCLYYQAEPCRHCEPMPATGEQKSCFAFLTITRPAQPRSHGEQHAHLLQLALLDGTYFHDRELATRIREMTVSGVLFCSDSLNQRPKRRVLINLARRRVPHGFLNRGEWHE